MASAKQSIPFVVSPQVSPQIQTTEHLPGTFQEALAAGWVVVHEETALSADEKTRIGKIVLGLEGRAPLLSISYTATTTGFQVGAPQLIQ